MMDDDPLHRTFDYQMQKLQLAVNDAVEKVAVSLFDTASREIQRLNTGETTMDDENWLERFWSNLCVGFGYLLRHPLWILLIAAIVAIIGLSIQFHVIAFLILTLGILVGMPFLLVEWKCRHRPQVDYAKIRRLELEMGLREEDEQDRREAETAAQMTQLADALSYVVNAGRLRISGGVQPTHRPDVIVPPTGGSGTKPPHVRDEDLRRLLDEMGLPEGFDARE